MCVSLSHIKSLFLFSCEFKFLSFTDSSLKLFINQIRRGLEIYFWKRNYIKILKKTREYVYTQLYVECLENNDYELIITNKHT